MNIWDKLQNLDKRVFYALLTLAIALPIISPLNMPIRITPVMQTAYDFIDKLPEGSTALIGYDYEPGNEIDLNPQVMALYHHLGRKKIKVVALSSFPPSPIFAEQTMVVLNEYGYKYGEDYVNLGYYAGGEPTFAAFAQDPFKIFPKDYRGNATADLGVMKNIKTLKDFSLTVTLNDGPANGLAISDMIRQANTAYGRPVLIGCTPVMGAPNMPYLQSGQAIGLVLGLSGAAEYELLVKKPGPGVRGMDSQSVAHMLIILFVVMGNIGYFITKDKQATGGAGK